MRNNLIFLVLFSLFSSIRGDPANDMSSKTASRLSFYNNPNEGYNETQEETAKTITEDEIANENEPKQVYKEKYNVAKKNTRIQEKIVSEIQRHSRNAAKNGLPDKKMSNSGLECNSCYGSGTRRSGENCFRGNTAKTQKCADVEQCFTELHPQYIKRGCTLPWSINRTFVCKCPLCNDKPSEDLTYYEYRTFGDWEYDNKRLKEPVVGLDLLCKVCETRGLNAAFDKKCRLGRNADYMQCGHNELCFTNIDPQIDFVSRGCISKPAFNKLYYFCNESKCNNLKYPNPRNKREDFKFRNFPLVKVSSSSCITERRIDILCIIQLLTLLFG